MDDKTLQALTALANNRATAAGLKSYVSPLLGLLIMSLPVLGSFYPTPDGLARWLPYIFAGLLLVLFYGIKRQGLSGSSNG